MKKFVWSMIFLFLVLSMAHAAEDPLTALRNETLSYFEPLSGTVVKVEGDIIHLELGNRSSARKGMRMKVMRDGAPFVHPVTKEFLGTVESAVGKIEIHEVRPDSVTAALKEGEARPGDKVRISDVKVRLFFCQDKNTDWYLSDEFHRKLKDSGKFELVDTALETSKNEEVISAARKAGAEAAIVLSSRVSGNENLFRQRLFWVSDGSAFVDHEVSVSQDYSKDLRIGGEIFSPKSGEAVTAFDLSFSAKMVATGDFDGDGKKEIALSTGKDLRVYRPGSSLQYLWEIKGDSSDDHLRIETVSLKNGKEAVIVISKRDDSVVSSVYELSGAEFRKVLEGNYFIRNINGTLLSQAYSGSDGFTGDVAKLYWNSEITKGERVVLPKGVNIYDFAFIQGADREPMVLAYDESGFLNLYDGQGTRIWRSTRETGGFLSTYRKSSHRILADSGEWSVKDRLIQLRNEVLAVERVPLLNMAKGMGYKKSVIRDYYWNGFSLEEGTLIQEVKGTILDYAVTSDEVIVLATPVMGLKVENILKGENPLGSHIFIYSIKGRL